MDLIFSWVDINFSVIKREKKFTKTVRHTLRLNQETNNTKLWVKKNKRKILLFGVYEYNEEKKNNTNLKKKRIWKRNIIRLRREKYTIHVIVHKITWYCYSVWLKFQDSSYTVGKYVGIYQRVLGLVFSFIHIYISAI